MDRAEEILQVILAVLVLAGKGPNRAAFGILGLV